MLFVGDDWAEDYHDVELQDRDGRKLVAARLPEGAAGVARLHALIGEHLAEDADAGQVLIGIETDRGPWVQALIAAGYTVYAINPLQVARYRERTRISGAKSDEADAHTMADMVRTDARQLRPVAGDSAEAAAIKVVARTHKTLIWDRTRQQLRLRSTLREFFPAALESFDDLTAPEVLELLIKAPDPASAARLSLAQISAALKRAGRYKVAERAEKIHETLRGEQLAQPSVVAAAYGTAVRAQAEILAAINAQVAVVEEQVEANFVTHPAAEIYLSQPGMGKILGARVLAEFGDDPKRYASAKARKNYAGTSPITRQSGKKKIVLARYVHQDRLVDALQMQAYCALTRSVPVKPVETSSHVRRLC